MRDLFFLSQFQLLLWIRTFAHVGLQFLTFRLVLLEDLLGAIEVQFLHNALHHEAEFGIANAIIGIQWGQQHDFLKFIGFRFSLTNALFRGFSHNFLPFRHITAHFLHNALHYTNIDVSINNGSRGVHDAFRDAASPCRTSRFNCFQIPACLLPKLLDTFVELIIINWTREVAALLRISFIWWDTVLSIHVRGIARQSNNHKTNHEVFLHF
uniref:Putative secreted protein n=1 Tax=Lutzomyia longipalpis TaxID=7200 RepID=A0A7G3AFU1_LUTLO